MRFLLCALVLVTSTVLVLATRMDTVYEWKYVDYAWKSEDDKQHAIDAGVYDYTKIVPMDVDRAPGYVICMSTADGRVFLSLLAFNKIPASVATVTNMTGPSGPLLKPYPDWSFYKTNDCDSIKNVYRIAIDKCERLWILDTIEIDFDVEQGKSIDCDAQLLAFDLKTDRLIHRIKIPEKYAVGQNGQVLLATPIVETIGRQCEDTTVFMADTYGNGLVIWKNGNLSRLENPLFKASAEAFNVSSGNLTEVWHAGILGMDISPELFPGEERRLYFHALASFDLYSASTTELKRTINGSNVAFSGTQSVLRSHALSIAFSAQGTLFMGSIEESAIACWNRFRELKQSNIEIVAQDNLRLQYTNGMKVIKDPNTGEEELWVLSNNFMAWDLGVLDFDEFNFRILKSPVKKLIAGKICEFPQENRRYE